MKSLKILKLIKKALKKEEQKNDSHWEIGENYLIRTVTMIDLGKLEKVTDNELVLSNASWIPDTGRFNQMLKEGDFKEVEMFNKKNVMIINRKSIIDAQKVDFPLPTISK